MYNTTPQRECRKGGVSSQNYVMAASCLAFPRAPGNWKASRTPGCDFIKVWNERSVTQRSHTWHPAAGPFFPASSPQPRALMTPLWKSVSLIPLRDPSTALSAADTNSIPDRSVRWKPHLSGLLINVAPLFAYLQCLSEIHDQGEDGRDCSKMARFPHFFYFLFFLLVEMWILIRHGCYSKGF